MKVALTTLGCKLNYAETSTYERGFVAHGLEVVPWSAVADVYVINTCAVTETAEKKSRNLMRRAHKANPDALVIVTGCYAELKKEKLYDIEGVSRVFGKRFPVKPGMTGIVKPGMTISDPRRRTSCPAPTGHLSKPSRHTRPASGHVHS